MLSMVGVGMYFKTDDSMQDFAVADKKLGLSVMTATMLATAVGCHPEILLLPGYAGP